MFTVHRSESNPIISPRSTHPWEASAVFNWSPVKDGKMTYAVYRAVAEADLLDKSRRQTSIIARAESTDGVNFTERLPFIVPDRDFDAYGCEDPRVTKMGDTYYIFYTALSNYPFNADGIKVAVALSKDMKTVYEKHLVTPFNAKAMTLFPDKVNGKYAALLAVDTDHPPSSIAYVEFEKIEDMWSPEFWAEWRLHLDSHTLNLRRQPEDQVEVGAQPLKTKNGWLIIYSHIAHYSVGRPVFGIEAVLLDLKNPRIVVGRTKGPFMVPELYYEQSGIVPNIVFPSGALIRNGEVEIYYGAADTHCAKASVSLDHLLKAMIPTEKKLLTRYAGNPIICPRDGKAWEVEGTLNAAAIDLNGSVHLLYRAAAAGNVSTLGYASLKDGVTVDERSEEPVYQARTDFEGFGRTNGAGCEDPRLVEIDGRVYMTYTAYDGSVPRVAVTSISSGDFVKKRWGAWTIPEVISEPGIPNKDASILPEKIDGSYHVFHRVETSICADVIPSLDFSTSRIRRCIEVMAPRPGMWDGKKIGLAGPLIKTKKGWLALYHGISETGTYRVGAALLDLERPTVVLARAASPILEPEKEYELKGIVNRVVFPCGAVVRKGIIYVYYGAADRVLCVAKGKLSQILDILVP